VTGHTVAILLWTLAGFLLGAIPFAWLMGRLFLHRDLRRTNDGNPGAANLWKAGGWPLGFSSLWLDFLKGAVPVGLAYFQYQIGGWAILPVALAPVAGHAFSPFLRFHGGKAIATSFGIWTGLTLWAGPTILGLSLTALLFLITVDDWAVMGGMAVLLALLPLLGAPPSFYAIWAGNLLILIWRHRHGLAQRPHWKRRPAR
jgi:glycerol-3-phosphate acyltransferase PlsY